MRPLKPIEVYVQGVRPLTAPRHTVTSLALLSRRTGIQDDLFRRTITALSGEFGGDPLVALRERRYTLTPTGWKVFKIGTELLAVGRGEANGELTEAVTVELAPEIDFRRLAEAVRAFATEYGGLVTVRFVPFDPDGIRQNLASGITSFAIALVNPDGSSGASPDSRPVQWSVLVPGEHDLADTDGPVPAEGLTARARVFVPHHFAEELAPKVGGGVNLVVVPTADTVRTAVAAKLGVGLDLDFGVAGDPEPFLRLSAGGLPPQTLGYFLPRKPEQLSEAARCLLDLIRTPAPATVTPATSTREVGISTAADVLPA